jgi:hypothetical protein
MTREQFHLAMSELLNSFCGRRAWDPLRILLPCYPMPHGITDEWVNLAKALKSVRVQLRHSLTDFEVKQVVRLLVHAAEAAHDGRLQT